MAYVAVTGGQEAIAQAEQLTQYYRLKGANVELPVEAIEKQMRLLVDRILSEGGMYAPAYAALALKQAEGDPSEAAFLIRAYRSTLPRNHYSLTVEPSDMRIIRRISSSFRDIPGGQLLGPTVDYTHRLLKFSLKEENEDEIRGFMERFLGEAAAKAPTDTAHSGVEEHVSLTFAKVADLLREQGLMRKPEFAGEAEPFDITRQKLNFPAPRSARLQTLSRGETGAMTALAYSSMRGYGAVHPTIGELRVGYAPVHIPYPLEEGADDAEGIYIGEVLLTEVESINSFTQDKESGEVQFLLGYGLCFGQNELKAIAMAILERSLETSGLAPAQDEEFVLIHIDSVESAGFVSHLKLPHYITFQSALDRIRDTQSRFEMKKKEGQYNANASELQTSGI
ncbi:carbon-phosphorus lyase complex subunit PhnI [Paenibacillus alkalitolerans]|uniref:carbon-phosphorus lyase complex subunit PhnI n=1 Tax=Paenibacillus alkalitolerans TaxID=2799335 RepID=UPI0018F7266E|nr:carbon-phosphorus lyase complex subunit PhnI [Paenibacillus alkalitolerans]